MCGSRGPWHLISLSQPPILNSLFHRDLTKFESKIDECIAWSDPDHEFPVIRVAYPVFSAQVGEEVWVLELGNHGSTTAQACCQTWSISLPRCTATTWTVHAGLGTWSCPSLWTTRCCSGCRSWRGLSRAPSRKDDTPLSRYQRWWGVRGACILLPSTRSRVLRAETSRPPGPFHDRALASAWHCGTPSNNPNHHPASHALRGASPTP